MTCGEEKDIPRPDRDKDLPVVCKCGARMESGLKRVRFAVRGDYNRPIVSTSMAFNTQDVAEHRKRFPNIELRIDEASKTAHPVLKSLTQKREYLRSRGFIDQNSF